MPSAALILVGLIRIAFLSGKPNAPTTAAGLKTSDDAVGVMRASLAILHLVLNAAVLGLAITRGLIKDMLDADTIVPALGLAFVAAVSINPDKRIK